MLVVHGFISRHWRALDFVFVVECGNLWVDLGKLQTVEMPKTVETGY